MPGPRVVIEDSAAKASLGALVFKAAVFELRTEDGFQPGNGGLGERATMVARSFLPLLPTQLANRADRLVSSQARARRVRVPLDLRVVTRSDARPSLSLVDGRVHLPLVVRPVGGDGGDLGRHRVQQLGRLVGVVARVGGERLSQNLLGLWIDRQVQLPPS